MPDAGASYAALDRSDYADDALNGMRATLRLQPPPRQRQYHAHPCQKRRRTSSTAVMGFGIAGMLRASVMVAMYGGICA